MNEPANPDDYYSIKAYLEEDVEFSLAQFAKILERFGSLTRLGENDQHILMTKLNTLYDDYQGRLAELRSDYIREAGIKIELEDDYEDKIAEDN